MISPIAFSLGKVTVRWYGVCAALGLIAGYQLQQWRCGKYGVKAGDVSDLTFICMLAGVVGARAAYVIRFWEDFADAGLMEIFMVNHGGLVFYGGFILAAIAGIVFCRLRRLPLFKMMDIMAPALPLAHAIGRIGCLINGCCFGFVYRGPFAVLYRNGDGIVQRIQQAQGLLEPDAVDPLPTFPIEGVAALTNLAICGLLLLLERRGLARNRLFLVYGLVYSVTRFLTEFGRGDYLLPPGALTPAQVTCLWLAPLMLISLVASYLYKRRKPSDGGTDGQPS